MTLASRADMGEIQTLQWACFEPALHEPMDVLTEDVLTSTTFVVRAAGRLVGTVRCQLLEDGTVWQVGLLMVAPDLRRQGYGGWLLRHAEQAAPASVTTYRLLTGATRSENIRMVPPRRLPATRHPGGCGRRPGDDQAALSRGIGADFRRR